MKILIIHSYYQFRGGEDAVFEAERNALIEAGNEVETYTLQNASYLHKPLWRQALCLFWNMDAYRALRARIRRFRPHVIHVHNLFPFLSPSVLWAARHAHVPVVVTLHNYRLLCANGLFYRADKPCTLCAKKFFPWPAIFYRCYRRDFFKTTLVAYSMFVHRLIGSWRIPRLFIAPTLFAAQKFSAFIPPQRLCVKPHFANGPQELHPVAKKRRVVFVGRLSAEKGLHWLLQAWDAVHGDVKLDIVGEGDVPLHLDPRIIFHGRLEPQSLHALLAQAAVVVVPSRCYETFSRIVVEAFAAGTAVIAASGTAPASLIAEGETGSVFARDDVAGFAALVELYTQDLARAEREGENAFAVYRKRYQAEENMELLLALYRRSMSAK